MKKRGHGNLFIGMLVAVIALGVGYAAITAIPLIINGSATAKANATDADFVVHFNDFTVGTNYLSYTETTQATGELSQEIPSTSEVNGTFVGSDKAVSAVVAADQMSADVTVSNLENIGDTFTIKIPVINESDEIGADLSVDVTNSNTDYFTVTSSLDSDSIASNGGTTYVNVVVALKRVPKVDDITGTFTVTLTADATEE